MVYSADERRGRSVERGTDSESERGVFTDNFGGLNTTASDLNCPFGDSPFLVNCDINISGKITKRKGTKILDREERSSGSATTNLGYALLPFNTGLKYNYLIEKFGSGLSIYEIDNDVVTELISKTNVWDTAGASVRANYVTTSEVQPRVIFTTGVNQPVQLKFSEQQQIEASGSVTSIDFEDSLSRFATASTSNTLVYINRVRFSGFGTSYAADTLTITGLPTLSVGDVVDIVYVSWQHIVDALVFDGDRFSQQTTRFNSVVTDQNVEIDSRLRDDVVPEFGLSGGEFIYNMRAYQSTVHGDAYTLINNREPGTSVEYTFGDGGRYVPAAGNKVNPSPLFFTFGVVDASGDPTALVTQRRRLLSKLNGGAGVVGTSLKVFVDGVEKSQSTKGFVTPPALPSDAPNSVVYGDYFLWSAGWTLLTDDTVPGFTISFEAADNIGVPFLSQIEIVNASTNHIGSGANGTVSEYLDGACQPAFGLGEFANYNTGSYPANVAFYQGRLVFSGMPANPLQVIFSEVGDSVKPGALYASFQIDQFATFATSAVSLILASSPDDFVTGLVTWQQSLFVFTRRAVFRLTGGDGVFTNINNFITRISQNGLVSPYSVTVTDKSILYLSDIGIFDLFLGIDGTEFSASEKTLKLRSKFGVTRDERLANLSWMNYDSVNRLVYVGLPEQSTTFTSYRLFVYSVFRESWTEYTTPGGFNLYYLNSYNDNTLGSGFIANGALYRDNVTDAPVDRILLKFYADRFIDYAFTYTGTGSTEDYLVPPERALFLPTFEEQHVYGTTPEKYIGTSVIGWRGFDTLPITNIQDIDVALETAPGTSTYDTLEFNVDYYKRPNGDIYLIENPGFNRSLRIRQRIPVTDSPFGEDKYSVTTPEPVTENYITYIDNVFTPSNSDSLTFSRRSISTLSLYEVEIDTTANSVIEIGQAYPAVYATPLLTQRTLANLKRVKHVYVYFDNTDGQDVYVANDVNSLSGQSFDELVGRPKVRLNASIALLYDNDQNGELAIDLYGFSSLVWDDSLFDIAPSANQYRRYTLFKEPLLGVGYSYQLYVWSFDETAFTLSGWQVTAMLNAERYINWTG